MPLPATQSSSSKSGRVFPSLSISPRKFLTCEKGNFALITCFVVPTLAIGILYGTDSIYRSSKIEKFNEFVDKACKRALTMTQDQVKDDAERKSIAETIFNGAFPGEYKNVNTTVEVSKNTATATVSAEFDPVLNMIASGPVAVQYTHTCEGIPPYPTDRTIVFRYQVPQRTQPFIRCWWAMKPKYLNWDGGHRFSKKDRYVYGANRKVNGGAVRNSDGSLAETVTEAQMWGIGKNGQRSGCWNPPSSRHVLPPYSTGLIDNEIGIELDYYYNTEIYKDVHLHPGHYELGFWYYTRRSYSDPKMQLLTNVVGAYIFPKTGIGRAWSTLGCVTDVYGAGWKYTRFNFIVKTYGKYRIAMRGDGLNDGRGGVINSVQLIYLNDLNTSRVYRTTAGVPEHDIETSSAINHADCSYWIFAKYG